MTTEKRDYSKLRPFDLEAFKSGEKALFINSADAPEVRTYIAGPDKDGRICVADEYGSFQIVSCALEAYYRAPLAWVHKSADEDVLWPVYMGDRLYWVTDESWIVAHEFVPAGQCIGKNGAIKNDDGPLSDVAWLENLTFTPPKVKREGWIAIKTAERPNSGDKYTYWCSHICATEKLARDLYGPSTSVVVAQVSFEDPAGQEGGAQ